MERYVLIVAGGSGVRMGASIPKQFLPLAGRPMLMSTIERFHRFDDECHITVVLPHPHIKFWKTLSAEHNFLVPHKIVSGGEERFHSVRAGLATLPDDGLVAIHDGVRPLVSAETIERCFAAAETDGSAIPVVASGESVRQLTPDGSRSLNRDTVKFVQTPQVFSLRNIKKSYRQDYSPRFTDDASVAEAAGFSVTLVDGNRENIKITTEDQLQYAENIIARFKD